jgi:fatty-acyl-CoA synthase
MATQPDLSPRWQPRYVRLVGAVPRTGTGKVQRRALRADAWHGDQTFVRDGDGYRPFGPDDERSLRAAFAAAGRSHLYPESPA